MVIFRLKFDVSLVEFVSVRQLNELVDVKMSGFTWRDDSPTIPTI
jgi:hypothetical protein